MRRDGSIHVTAVGFTVEEAHGCLVVRIITDGASQKVRNVLRDPRASVAHVDGARWISFSGTATVSDEPEDVADAVARYARRYRQPRENPTRVVVRIAVERAMGSRGLLEA
ncbi:PPOX class F420-dependent enzyme [Agrococcus terreus]|uniref:PPOX class F420-dependent enzyme n=2 Tax=Agrococcus terreus TaxID=574649 RepID=A0ABQ2K9E7_9MICO|nr:PPOX class F420-dependent enzyme [Agrococcus terreus]